MSTYLHYLVLLGLLSYASALGKFWHISDPHLDPNYSLVGDPSHMCHVTNISSTTGKYGNILCDAPYELIKSAIDAMVKEEPKPDFILWTGDNAPHVPTEWPAIYDILKNLTVLLQSSFPNIAILPTIGNHDTFPANQLPAQNSTILYQNFLDLGGWGQLTPFVEDEDARNTFLKGGYYASKFFGGKLTILNLNTILWYNVNPQVANEIDPNGQLKWLEDQLKQARENKFQVYLTGHIPPGQEDDHTRFHPRFEKAYLSLMDQYQDVITSQFFGHLHRDTFRLFTNYTTGEAFGSIIIASSFTPMYDPKWPSRPVNPTIRLVEYRAKSDLVPEDYHQYYLDLKEANEKGTANWQLLYHFREQYNEVPDLSTSSLVKLISVLAPSPERQLEFTRYFTGGLAFGKPINPQRLLCEVSQSSNEGFNLCIRSCVQNAACHTGEDFMKPPAPSPPGPRNPGSGLSTIQVIVIVCAALIIIGITFYIGHRKLRQLQDKQNFEYTRF